MSFFRPEFEATTSAVRVRFGPGARHAVRAEIEALGRTPAIVLSTPTRSDTALNLAESIGKLAAGVFPRATMHTPVSVTEDAVRHVGEIDADCVVAIGGGSTTGLGKAIALRTGMPQIVVPTTYAGSEATAILGQTEFGRKTTITDPRVQPEVIIYDPELLVSLPVSMTMASALNAMAHAAEALYARNRNPVSSILAIEGMRAFVSGLPRVAAATEDVDARAETLYGAWLCGTVLGQVGMALHHKLCHTLGGSFDLPHAETHAIVLPHAIAFNETAVPELLAPVAELLDGDHAGHALHRFATSVGAPFCPEGSGACRERSGPRRRDRDREPLLEPAACRTVYDPCPASGRLGGVRTPPGETGNRRRGPNMIEAHETGFFTEENSAEIVNGRNKNSPNQRVKDVMEAVTRKLHEAIKEIEPTQEEWFQAIIFLTRTGHMCDDWRQEFILLSDVLGVSMLVDAVNSRRPTGASENTVLGPFHVADAPEYPMGTNICLDQKGEDLVVRGRILDTEGHPINGAKIDVWQANDEGFYDVQQKGIQPDFNLRGVFVTGKDGTYWFRAVKPRHYSIPADGPVGDLLRDLGRHPFRPAHLHFIVSAKGYDRLTTHIFDPDDPYIESDAVFGVKESLTAAFKTVDDPARAAEVGFSGPFLDVEFDFVLAPKTA